MESDIDISIANIWRAWQAFVSGKCRSGSLRLFYANLETNLINLQQDLKNNNFQHGGYQSFVVHDPKRREIAVACIRDRVVHRLLYDYLVMVWDKTFCYDAWSCRKGKGLLGAIDRAEQHAKKYQHGWIWRSDITKFFDSVHQEHLQFLLRTKLDYPKVLWLLDEVIKSYTFNRTEQNRTEQNRTEQNSLLFHSRPGWNPAIINRLHWVCQLVTLPAKYSQIFI